MSLINQPIFRSGILIRKIESYFQTNVATVTQLLSLGSAFVNSSFATNALDRINITRSAKYRVTYSAYTRLDTGGLGTGTNFSQFRLDTTSSSFAVLQGQTGSPISNSFANSLYYNFGQSSLSGSLPVSGGLGGVQADCIFMASGEAFLNQGDYIGLYFGVTGSSGYTKWCGMSGYIFVEEIS